MSGKNICVPNTNMSSQKRKTSKRKPFNEFLWPTIPVEKLVAASCQCQTVRCFWPVFQTQKALTSTDTVQKKLKTQQRIRSSLFCRSVIPSLFVVASCKSQDENYGNVFDIATKSNSTFSEDEELTLPGMQVKKAYVSQESQTIGEVEIHQWLQQETGLDRVRSMYSIDSKGQFAHEDTRNLFTMLYRTTLIGFCLNAYLALKNSDKGDKSLSKSSAISKGVISRWALPTTVWKESLKNTFRLTILAASLMHLSQTISAYRNETSVREYTIAGAVGFGSLKISGGIRQFAAFTLTGAVLGTLGGLLVCKFLTSTGLTQEQRHMRWIKETLEQRRQDRRYQ